MRILLLSEGDAETPRAFSGIGKSVVEHLRARGQHVQTGDVDLAGAGRLLVAGRTWSRRRARWVAKYHVAAAAFRARSRNAERLIRPRRDRIDAVLQVGATFSPLGRGDLPLFMLCDANFKMGERSPSAGWAAPLRPGEIAAVVERERSVYEQATTIFTLSEMARRSFLSDFGIAPTRVVTVHAGPNFDLARIPAQRPVPADGHAPTILFVGREFERKGGDLVLAAFERVRRVIPNARLRLVGLRDMTFTAPGVESLGLLRKDDPAEWRRLADAYATADVFAFPTRFEPFGIVVLEAMFFGLPCVATDAWALPEMIVDGETGFTVPMDDVDALTDRLTRLLADPALARRMGEAGRARAHRHFTWDEVARKMTEAMEAALAAPHATGV